MTASELTDAVLAIDDSLMALMTPAELDEYDDLCAHAAAAWAVEHEDDWAGWLRLLFPDYFRAPFAAHHEELWRWVWSIEMGKRPSEAFVGVFPRGGAKSTSAEAAVAALGARQRRRFCLYVCSTQPQADDHVQNVAGMLESKYLEMAYPELGSRAVGKFGTSKGWRRNRLRTASGLVVDALGLDTAARGIKVDEYRPDLLVLDDIDSEKDGPGQTERKIIDVTQKLLPTGDRSLAVLVIQNIPNPQGVVARLAGIADEPAEFLRPRIVCGPVPALEGATYDLQADGTYLIVAGEPTWAGQDLLRCQEQVNEWGLTAFRAEAQHETDARGGGMFDHLQYRHCRFEEVPWGALTQVAVWCDPAVTTTDNSDSQAVQCDGLATDGTVFRLRSWEERATPVAAIKVAVAFAIRFGTRKVGIETDQGGDTWNSVYKEAVEEVRADLATLAAGGALAGPGVYAQTLVEIAADDLVFPLLYQPAQEKAGVTQQSKAGRAQQMLAAYETHPIVHVLGTHLVLERGLNRFPARRPFDIVDAAYWALRDLLKFGQGSRTSARKFAQRSFTQPPPGQQRPARVFAR